MDVTLIWNGKDISDYVNVTGCVHRNVSTGRSDALELTLDHASDWYRWKPEEDDEIIVNSDGYTTGAMYLNAVMPEGDQFRVLATGVKRAAARRAWASYRDTTLERIFEACAAECGMRHELYGIDGSLAYPYVIRRDEGCAAFLARIGEWEGIAVKTRQVTLKGVSVIEAQNAKPAQVIEIGAKQPGVAYRRRENTRYTGLTVRTPWAEASARDGGAKGNNHPIMTWLPALDNAQAGRWARGLLLMNNRRAEELTIDQSLNTAMRAMTRIDVTGATDMAGQWLVDEAEHDLVNRTTTTRLLRVIDTIQ